MTTWDEPCFSTDTLSRVLHNCPKDENIALGFIRKLMPKIVYNPGVPWAETEQITDIKQITAMFPNAFTNRDEYTSVQLLNILNRYPKVNYGLDAVYKLWYLFYDGRIEYVNEIDMNKVNQYVHAAAITDFYGSKFTPKRIKKMIDNTKMPTREYSAYRRCMESSYTATHLAYFWRTTSMKDKVNKAKRSEGEYPPISRKDFELGKNTVVYALPGLQVYIYVDPKTDEEHCMLLDMKSLRRLSQLLRSTAKVISYYHITGHRVKNRTIVNAAVNILDEITKAAYETDRTNELARALDVLFNWELAKISTDVWDRALKLQKAKYIENDYDRIIGAQHFQKFWAGFKVFERLDLAKIYKILPCPDFDPTNGFYNMKQYHDTPNPVQEIPRHLQASMTGVNLSWQEMEDYRRFMYIKRYYSRHKICPGVQNLRPNPPLRLQHYPHVDPSHLKVEDVQFLDLRGSAIWKDTDNNSPGYYTDKACTPNNVNLNTIPNGAAYYEINIYERTYLGWYLQQPDIPPGYELRKMFYEGRISKQQMSFFKPESKKPDPRNFYSAKPYARRMVAEYEENVREYLRHDVASFMGLDPHQTRLALNKILGTENDRDRFQWVWISFDLEKFSPRMPAEYKDLTFGVWDEVFAQPNIGAVRDYFNNMEVHYLHEGIKQSYVVNSIDMEGQSATVNTCMHTDLMAMSMRKLRQAGLCRESGRLAVFVDDGLLGIPFPNDITKADIIRSLNIIDATYQFYGMKISWDKTFVSTRLAIFLNELYYDGVNVTTGVKAFLRMQPTKLEDELSVSGKLKGLTGMALGCIQTGIPPYFAKIELLREVTILLMRNLKGIHKLTKMSPELYAWYLVVPVQLGGLGLPFTETLAKSPNPDPVGEFLSCAWYIALTQAHLKPLLNDLLDQPMRVRKDIDILRQPSSVRVAGRTITESKHIPYVLAEVRSQAKHTTLRPMLHLDMLEVASTILDALGNDVDEAEVTATYKMSPIFVVDNFLAKFKRSSTLMGILKPRIKFRLISRYMTELTIVTNQFVTNWSNFM